MRSLSEFDWIVLCIGTLVIILSAGALLGGSGYFLGMGFSFCLFSFFSMLQYIKTLLVSIHEVQIEYMRRKF